MERDTTFKDHHFWELQRRDALHNSLTLPVGVLTLAAGGVLAMVRAVSMEFSIVNVGLISALIITTGLLFGNLYCLTKALIKYKYSHAPDMVQWLDDRKHFESEFRTKWRAVGLTKAKAEHEAQREFYCHLDETYAKSATNNSAQNKRKAEWIAKGHRFLIGGVGFLMVAGAFFSFTPVKPTDDVSPKPRKDTKATMILNNPEKPVKRPEPLPPSKPEGIVRPPVREPVVSNEKFPTERDLPWSGDL